MVPTRLACSFIDPAFQRRMEIVGIHASPFKALPLFLVYLSTLMHTYSLATRHPDMGRLPAGGEGNSASSTPHLGSSRNLRGSGSGGALSAAAGSGGSNASLADVERGLPPAASASAAPRSRHLGGARRSARSRNRMQRGGSSVGVVGGGGGGGGGAGDLGEAVSSAINGALQRAGATLVTASVAVWEFLVQACTGAERPPHFVLVSTAAGEGGAGELAGAELEMALQRVLDEYRERDLAAARREAGARVSGVTGGGGLGVGRIQDRAVQWVHTWSTMEMCLVALAAWSLPCDSQVRLSPSPPPLPTSLSVGSNVPF
jgi:hypothetical protein